MSFFNFIVSRILYVVLGLLDLTLRYRYIESEGFKNLKSQRKPYLLSIWHQVLVAGVLAQKGRPFAVMVSRSKDGDSVAYLCRKLKFHTFRGSSAKGGRDKGGLAALSEMVTKVKAGFPGSMAVDGPTGPAKIVKKGIVRLSHETGAVIVPYHAAIESYWEFNSWDKFRFPKPFSRIIISYGEPIDVSEMNVDQSVTLVTDKMNDTEKKGYDSFKDWESLEKKEVEMIYPGS